MHIRRQVCNLAETRGVEYHRIIGIPGFGPSLAGNLVAWRRDVERRFHFDPAKGVDPRDVAAVDREIQIKRAKLEQTLATGVTHLRHIAAQIAARRQAVQTEHARVAEELAQAEADLKAMRAF